MGSVESAEQRIEALLWPFVERVVETWALPGVAMSLTYDGTEVTARGFGVRSRVTREPVTADTLFHCASVSKTFVATAVLQLVESGVLDLDTGLSAYLPDLPWGDPRAGTITVRHLLSHQSGLGDVADYGWHRPEVDDEALSRFARVVAGWRLEHDPGEAFAYSNAAYELLGHLVAVTSGQAFEPRLRTQVLDPLGMATSTFVPGDIPRDLAADPHLGLPPQVVAGAYPYTRQHAPSSSLHSSANEMARWMTAHLHDGAGLMSPATHRLQWQPEVEVGEGPWQAQMTLGWFSGSYRNLPLLSHTGTDPGFEASLALLRSRGMGVTVLTNSNTAPLLSLTRAALDVLLGHEPAPPPPPPATVHLAPVLVDSGPEAAAETFRRLAAAGPLPVGDGGFSDAVWGLIEVHRTDLARPLLDLWQLLQPDCSDAELMAGWACDIDGRRDEAIEHLRRAVELDPENDDAATMLRRLQAAG